MGFLDFLKKQPPAPVAFPETPVPEPPKQTPDALPPLPIASRDDQLLNEMVAAKNNAGNIELPVPPTGKPDFLEAAAVDTTPEKEPIEDPMGAASAKTSVPTGTMLAGPLRREQIPPELTDDSESERVPLPPVSMQDPDFLTSAANDFKRPEARPEPAKTTVEQVPVAAIDLPDFTDDDIASLDKPTPPVETIRPWASEPVQQTQSTPQPIQSTRSEPTVKIKTQEPLAPAPANAIARPKEEMLLPTGETLIVGEAEPAKFLSSDNYFMIMNEIKAARKTLRQEDDIIKDATLAHEQLDVQHKRVAIDANAVQEQLMKIDRALFEE